MSEDQKPAQEEQAQGKFSIQKIYTKDISFEAPNSPAIFQDTQWQPNINVQLGSQAKKLNDSIHEVVLTVTVTAKQNDQTAFLVEIQQAGIFQAEGIDASQIGHLLGSYCPNILFPYAREVISDLLMRGGFPQFILAPVNFDTLYAKHMQEQQATAAAPAGDATTH